LSPEFIEKFDSIVYQKARQIYPNNRKTEIDNKIIVEEKRNYEHEKCIYNFTLNNYYVFSNIKFTCDVPLYKLGRQLRGLGIDTYIAARESDSDIVRTITFNEHRILLCKTKQLYDTCFK